MSFEQPKIQDIQVSDILYYHERSSKKLLKFCTERDIDFLPLIDKSNYSMGRKGKSFEEVDIKETQKVSPDTPVFEKTLLDKFRKHKVLFVFSYSELSGIVHFSDYENPLIGSFLFSYLAECEILLRKYLAANGYKDQDVLSFLEKISTGSINNYERATKNLQQKPNLLGFSLKDLMRFSNEEFGLNLDVDNLYKIRNQIMHHNPLVQEKDYDSMDYIYSFDSFEKFWGETQILIQERKRIKSQSLLFSLMNS